MRNITIQLQPETERCLKEKAEQGGQTLEAYLEQLADHEARAGNGTAAVFFSSELTIHAEQLPKRQSSLNMNWHRIVSDDE